MMISQRKIRKIEAGIIEFLSKSPNRCYFTSQIADFIIRDEEFTKKLLQRLKKSEKILCIYKNSKGQTFSKRRKWQIRASYNNEQMLNLTQRWDNFKQEMDAVLAVK